MKASVLILTAFLYSSAVLAHSIHNGVDEYTVTPKDIDVATSGGNDYRPHFVVEKKDKSGAISEVATFRAAFKYGEIEELKIFGDFLFIQRKESTNVEEAKDLQILNLKTHKAYAIEDAIFDVRNESNAYVIPSAYFEIIGPPNANFRERHGGIRLYNVKTNEFFAKTPFFRFQKVQSLWRAPVWPERTGHNYLGFVKLKAFEIIREGDSLIKINGILWKYSTEFKSMIKVEGNG